MSEKTVRTGFVGLGDRGLQAVERFLHLDGASIAAVCDVDVASTGKAVDICRKAGFPEPACYCGPDGWKELCMDPSVDLVYICTPWHTHAQMAIRAMECGKHAAVEVPAAMTVAECYDLVRTSERTGMQCAMLENCIYGDFELAVLNMVQKGLLGEIVHCEGGYAHQIAPDREPWRAEYNRRHRGDLYPTHGLGPVARVLDINRSDRMVSLVSVDTGVFRAGGVNADQTTTIIRTEKGKTIVLAHNVVTPRPYSRGFQVVGTNGFAAGYPLPQVQIGGTGSGSDNPAEGVLPEDELERFLSMYRHPLVLEDDLYERSRTIGRHGGIDYIMDWRLIHCLREGLSPDVDAYDAACWCSVIELSERSILAGSVPVAVPDFRNR